jgi:mercuric ion transport protein
MHANEGLEKPSYSVTGLATGGLAASILASSCCILPLALVSTGVSGSWISTLTSMSPFQPYFVLAAAGFIGWGLRQAYRKQTPCVPGTICGSPAAGWVTKSLLWAGAVLAIAAASVDTVLPLII